LSDFTEVIIIRLILKMLKFKLIKERLKEQTLLGGRSIVYVFMEPGEFRQKQRLIKGTLKVILSDTPPPDNLI
jgi:hypothetical protein